MKYSVKYILPLILSSSLVILFAGIEWTLFLQLTISISLVYFFNIGNTNKQFGLPLSIAFFLLPITSSWSDWDIVDANIISWPLAGFLVIIYLFRVRNKSVKGIPETLGALAIIQLATVLSFYREYALISYAILACSYFYGRSIRIIDLKTEFNNTLLGLTTGIAILALIKLQQFSDQQEKSNKYYEERLEDYYQIKNRMLEEISRNDSLELELKKTQVENGS